MWQPIDTCPEDGSEFLAYDPVAQKFDVCSCTIREGVAYSGRKYRDRDLWQTQMDGEYGPCDDEFQAARATHWMPLPEPPLPKETTTT